MPPPLDWYALRTTPPWLPFRSALMTVVLEGVNVYQTVCGWNVQGVDSPGSVVVPLRSPLSVNGRVEITSASAKLSLAGGDEKAGLGPANRNKAQLDTTSSRRNAARVRVIPPGAPPQRFRVLISFLQVKAARPHRPRRAFATRGPCAPRAGRVPGPPRDGPRARSRGPRGSRSARAPSRPGDLRGDVRSRCAK